MSPSAIGASSEKETPGTEFGFRHVFFRPGSAKSAALRLELFQHQTLHDDKRLGVLQPALPRQVVELGKRYLHHFDVFTFVRIPAARLAPISCRDFGDVKVHALGQRAGRRHDGAKAAHRPDRDADFLFGFTPRCLFRRLPVIENAGAGFKEIRVVGAEQPGAPLPYQNRDIALAIDDEHDCGGAMIDNFSRVLA